MLFTQKLPKNKETLLTNISDEVIQLTRACLAAEETQSTRLYAVHGSTRYLIASLDPKTHPQTTINFMMLGSQEIRLLSDYAPINVFGSINEFDEFMESDEEEEDASQLNTDEDESESELEEEMVRPQPPRDYVPPKQIKSAPEGKSNKPMKAKKSGKEAPRDKKIAKAAPKTVQGPSKASSNGQSQPKPKKQAKKESGKTAKAQDDAQNLHNAPPGHLEAIFGKSPEKTEAEPASFEPKAKPIPNVTAQLGKIKSLNNNKRFERLI